MSVGVDMKCDRHIRSPPMELLNSELPPDETTGLCDGVWVYGYMGILHDDAAAPGRGWCVRILAFG